MPSIKIEKQTKLTADDSFKRISNMLSNDRDLRKLDSKYKCEFNEKDRTGSADGSMFKAKMNVKASGDGSSVQIVVDLPMHLALVKGMVEKTLQKKLEEALS
ncbi:MAG: polyhydroxyalkanoic acid system family protein [Bdellovibrionales bacterium]